MPAQRRSPRTTSAALDFNHAMVYVRELAPALHFYADLLGFKLIEQYATAYARLQSPRGRTTIALHLVEPGKTPVSDGMRLYFETKDLDKFVKRLQAAGAQFTQLPKIMPWGWMHAYLNDPDGHEVSLYWAGKKRFQKSTMARR